MLERHVLDESDLKALVLNEVRRQALGGDTPVVANEYRVGSTSVRADMAFLGSEFVGVEIKSERDSLKRIRSQVDAYSLYFDRVIVVVADRHLRHLDWKALRAAEVWKVDRSGRVTVAAQQSQFAGTACLSTLLTHKQRVQNGLLNSPSPSEDHVREVFEREFRKRFGSTSAKFWLNVEGRAVRAEDLATLSRFKDVRETIKTWELERKTQHQLWLQAVQELERS